MIEKLREAYKLLKEYEESAGVYVESFERAKGIIQEILKTHKMRSRAEVEKTRQAAREAGEIAIRSSIDEGTTETFQITFGVLDGVLSWVLCEIDNLSDYMKTESAA